MLCPCRVQARTAVPATKESDYYWHRDLWLGAVDHKSDMSLRKEFKIKTRFKEIYIGHTPTSTRKPEKLFNIINMDTGAGSEGRLTIMDIDSKEYWQSAPLSDLYIENFRDE